MADALGRQVVKMAVRVLLRGNGDGAFADAAAVTLGWDPQSAAAGPSMAMARRTCRWPTLVPPTPE